MMLLRTPQMLKKSGINKGNVINYLAFIDRIVHVCVEEQSAVKPRDVIGGKERTLHSLWSVEEYPTIRLPLPYRLPYPPKYLFIFIPVSFLFNFTHFSYNYGNYSMFRDVPECCMFLVLSTANLVYLYRMRLVMLKIETSTRGTYSMPFHVFHRRNHLRSTLGTFAVRDPLRSNRPFPSSLVPLFQNKSKCQTFHMKMSSACSFIFMQIKVIFIRMVSHLDSL